MFVLLPFAMILGLAGYVQLPEEPSPLALGGLVLLALGLLGALRRSMQVLWAGLLTAALLGACLLPIHGWLFGTPMLAWPAYGLFEARVDEIVSATDEDRRVIVTALLPLEGTRAVPIRKARLTVPPQPPLAPGDIIRARMRLAPVPGPILPGAFDGQFHAYFAGVGAYGTATSDFALVQTGSSYDLLRGVELLRMGIGQRIDAQLDGVSAAIGRAMVVGDQSAISDETRYVMAQSGLAHIYSISGLHLSIVAGGIFWLLRWLLAAVPATTGRLPVKRIAAVAGLLAAMGYMLLAGGLANVPALRSAMMLGLIFGAVLAGRQALTMRNVAIVAIVIIAIDPASVFRASFQLSFAAVVALIGVYEMPRQSLPVLRSWPGRLWDTVWATALTSLIAGAATLLFSAYHFQQTAPLGVISNVLVLPVVGLIIMPFAVLSVLAMPLGIEAPFLLMMGWGIDRMVDVATLVAGWSENWTGNPLLTGWALLIGLVALGWFAFFPGRLRFLGPAAALPLVLIAGLEARPDVLVADSTQAVAVRTQDGMGLISGSANSFVVQAWIDHYQWDITEGFADLGCDSLGCIAHTPDFSIAVVKNTAAFVDDCGAVDLVIARMDVPRFCSGSQIIDADTLARGGVQWLAWDRAAARFIIRAAIPSITRPWRVVPR